MTKLSLIFILILAAVLRLWTLGGNPIHLTQDEASLGYNAYSILHTGRDEYGTWFPLVFKSFGDFKPGLYVYLTVPSVALFGLTEFATRFPGALTGIIAVWLVYLLAHEFYPQFEIKIKNYQLKIGEITAFLTAISPWHIHLSRGAWETNLSLTITLAGILFFAKGLKLTKYLYVSAIFFGLTFLAYQGAKLATPLVLVALILSQHREIKVQWRKLIKPAGLFLLVVLPILFSLRYGSGRLRVFNLFSYRRPDSQIAQILNQDNSPNKNSLYYLYHSESLNQLRVFLLHYFSYFSPRFLMFEGDWTTPRHATPYHGVIYIFDAALVFAGIYYLTGLNNYYSKFLIIWLLLAPIPSALSRDLVHGVRSFNLVIPLVMLTSIGLFALINRFGKYQKLIFVSIFLLYSVSLIRFLDLELVHSPQLTAQSWYYGYKQVVNFVTPVQDNYSQVVVAQSFDQPYIFFLFYQKYDPAKWWSQAKLVENSQGDAGFIEKLDNIHFRPLSWSGDKYLLNTLIIGAPFNYEPSTLTDPLSNLIQTITYPNGNPAFYIFQTKS